MKSVFGRRAAALFAALAVLVFAIPGVNAQGTTGNGFRISPVRTEYVIEKGETETLNITLENPADVKVIAKPAVNDFVASDKEDGEPRLILDDNAPSPKNSFKKLVQPIAGVELGPRERKDIPVTIRVPDDANSGGYYGAIRFIPQAGEQTQTVGLSASVGSIVLVRVPGNLVERLDLVQLSAAQNGNAKSFITSGNVQSLVRLKNSGDIHVKPFGRVQIKNMFGSVIAEYELNNVEPRANILPESTRKFVDNLDGKKWFGRYTIETNIGYSQGSGDLISAKSTFWYLPVWSLILLALLVVGLIGGGYIAYRKYSLRSPKHGIKKKK